LLAIISAQFLSNARAARNVAIVIGGGFAGIAIAAELPMKMCAILGDDASARVIVIEKASRDWP